MVKLEEWIEQIAASLNSETEPEPQYYTYFLHEPELALALVKLIDAISEDKLDDERSYYSACIYAFDICVAQLQSACEGGNKLANKIMQQLMTSMAVAIESNQHSLGFWLPVLNAFYEAHVELSEDLKAAYLNLATEEDEYTPEEEVTHLNSIRELIAELSDLSVFDIAENFFAQSYAMPPEFFIDFITDLYSIEEGHDIALLTLLHPKEDVREMVIQVLDSLMPSITLSSASLSRLKAISYWYPSHYQKQFNRWIKMQRKKGVVFAVEHPAKIVHIKASEVDGSGAQGLFFHLRERRKNFLCGLLLKNHLGIKDAWVTPYITAADAARYYDEAFDDTVMLCDVDLDFILAIANHFLAITLEQGGMPNLHLLAIQEALGLHFIPTKLDVDYLIESLGVKISPFTNESIELSLKRSKTWPKNKRFTESWYLESAEIDKLVNQCCSFVDGVKVCRFDEAEAAVFAKELERHREQWIFHFLWITLWLKAAAKKNDLIWQDSFIIAYAIQQGRPLKSIPIMREICKQSVIYSMETMQERRTYLT